MLVPIDVRRTPGGLQLTVLTTPTNAWATRLNYRQADELVTALCTDTPAYLTSAGEAALAYIPHYPEPDDGTLARIDGEVTEDLRNATHEVRSGLEQMQILGDLVRAHMPDQLPPLPHDPAVPWTPTPLD